MEYASGGDLQAKINGHKKAKTLFPEEEVWKALIHMSKGLQTLHEMKILHRDLKCANVFLYADGAYKLGKQKEKITSLHKLIDFWYFQRWYERIESSQERFSLHINRHSVLCIAWGLEGLTIWHQEWHLVIGVCAIWNVQLTTTVQSEWHGRTLQESLEGSFR